MTCHGRTVTARNPPATLASVAHRGRRWVLRISHRVAVLEASQT
jgi:hypothetical protein